MPLFDSNKENRFSSLGSKAIGNFVFKLVEFDPEYILSCRKNCIHADQTEGGFLTCKYGPKHIKDWKSKVILVAMEVAVMDGSENSWSINSNDVKIIDNLGYCYDGELLCNDMAFPVPFPKGTDSVYPGTRRVVFHYFEPLPEGRTVGSILVSDGRRGSVKFDLEAIEFDPSTFDDTLFTPRPTKASPAPVAQPKLDNNVNRRLTALEQSVRELNSKLDLLLSQKASPAAEPHVTPAPDYSSPLQVETVSQLLSLDLNRFTDAIVGLLGKQGFQEIEPLVQQSSYEGRFLKAKKYGSDYVVYCLTSKDSVDPNYVSALMDEKKRNGADKGMLITTGTFTRSAEIIAYSNAIEIVDKGRLAIQLSLKDDTFGYQPTQ